MTSSRDELLRRVEALRQQGDLVRAVAFQRKVCEEDRTDVEQLTRLATLAHDAGKFELELAARYGVAKLAPPNTDGWLTLSGAADEAGFEDDAIDALHRAAESAAKGGDPGRALEICTRLLSRDPGREDARQLQEDLAAARTTAGDGCAGGEHGDDDDDAWIEDEPEQAQAAGVVRMAMEPHPAEEDDDESFWEDESTVTFLRRERPEFLLSSNLSTGADSTDGAAIEEMTRTGPAPKAPDLGSTVVPTPERYVCMKQPWPTVLDSSGLIFVGQLVDLSAEVSAFAETISLTAGSQIYHQGKAGQLVYLLDAGSVHATRVRGKAQDFGTISAGSFFGEIGAITNLPCTTNLVTDEPCMLRVITRKKLNSHLQDGSSGVAEVVASLKVWYLETVISICPILNSCDDETLLDLVDTSRLFTLPAGASLAAEGDDGLMYVIVMGMAKVTAGRGADMNILGFVTSGDLVGGTGPSPVNITAVNTISVIPLDREKIARLPDRSMQALRSHSEACRDVASAPPSKSIVFG